MKVNIEAYGYGGELTIGTVSNEFVEYWQDKPAEDLERHVIGLSWDDNIDLNHLSYQLRHGMILMTSFILTGFILMTLLKLQQILLNTLKM